MSECGPQVCRNGHGPTAGSGPNSQISKPEAQTAVVHEEDIDPFSYRPPLTRWNYVKVSRYVVIGIKKLEAWKSVWLCIKLLLIARMLCGCTHI